MATSAWLCPIARSMRTDRHEIHQGRIVIDSWLLFAAAA